MTSHRDQPKSRMVTALRTFFLDRRLLAAAIVALALFVKILVPTGFMIGSETGTVTIELCSGTGPMKMTMVMPGMEHHQHKPDHQGKEMPCAFSGLTAPALAAADSVLLAIALIFIVETTFRLEIFSVVRAPDRLRPPLRGPPQQA
jgi:hypothetical protein